MSTFSKLAGFAVVLALLFGGGALAGVAAGPLGDDSKAAGDDPKGMAGMDGEAEGQGGHAADGAQAPRSVRGLAVSDDGLTLRLDRTRAPRGKRFELAFRITGRDGRTVRDFDVEHTKRMHVIVVRRDMTGFQHLHPRQTADGGWSVPVTLREAGSYRVFADFSTGETPRTLAADLAVGGAWQPELLPAPEKTAETDGLRVTLASDAAKAGAESELGFDVTRGGRPVAVEDYLGAKGHLVALREGDLAFLHVHPDEKRLSFMAEFPSAGSYRLFLQFKVAGRIHTAAFTQEVSR